MAENTSGDSLDAYTFFDSKTWGIFYGYNHIIIIFTIIISSYFLAKQIKVEYSSYKFENDIHYKLGYISTAIRGLHKKYNHDNYKNRNRKHSKSYSKVKNITCEMVLDTIDIKFNEMHKLLDEHKQQLTNKVLKMTEKAQRESSSHAHGHDHDELQSMSSMKNATAAEKSLASVIISDEMESEKKNDDVLKSTGLQTVIGNNHNREQEQKDVEQNVAGTYTVTNIIRSEAHVAELNPIISKYVSKELSKHDMSKTKIGAFKKFLSILWDIRKIMFMAFSHVFDTASDVALAIEWYILYQRQDNDPNYFDPYDIDMAAMFWCCISVIIYYRISSSWEIYKFSHSFVDVFWQFFFDFYLIKLIYVNVFKMKTYSPMKIIKIMRSIEGQNESAFQSILTMVFLIKTNFGQFDTDDGDDVLTSSAAIAIFSFAFSFWSLTSRFIFLDFDHLKPTAQIIGINANEFSFGDINIWYLFHVVFRLVEVLLSILIISLIWVVFGGLWLVITVAVVYVWLIMRWKLTEGEWMVFKNNFLAKLMVFDIEQIRVGFNIIQYIPYSDLRGSFSICGARFLFAFLGCWLLFVRVFLCSLISASYSILYDGVIATESAIVCTIIFIIVWFIMFAIAINFYINRDHTAIVAATASNELNGINIIKSNDEESIIFCKELSIDVFRHKNYKTYSPYPNFANNVLDAMIISDNFDNYLIVEQWYYNIGYPMKEKKGYNFEDFLKNFCEWNKYTIDKLAYNCDSLDYYVSIHDKLGLDMSLAHSRTKMNILHYAVWYGRNIEIIGWLLESKIIDVNETDMYGWTCLHFLMDYIYNRIRKEELKIPEHNLLLINEQKITRLLLSCGADPSIKSSKATSELEKGCEAKECLKEFQDKLYDWLVKGDD